MTDLAPTSFAPACFAVIAEADAQILMRVMGYFAQRSIIPAEVRMTAADGMISVMIRQRDLDPWNANIIAEKLRSNPLVHSVDLQMTETCPC